MKCENCNREQRVYTDGQRKAPSATDWFSTFRKEGHKTMTVCEECYTKLNGGRPPLGLRDIDEIRRRGITREQYYNEHGYD